MQLEEDGIPEVMILYDFRKKMVKMKAFWKS